MQLKGMLSGIRFQARIFQMVVQIVNFAANGYNTFVLFI